MPLHQPQFDHDDMVVLVSSVLVTLLRRDMGLNRRLFTWLLGTEINTSLLPDCHPIVQQGKENYFNIYTSELLIKALLRLLEQSIPSGPVPTTLDIKPFRIITTLLDKAEIGPVIIDQVMVDIFRCLYHMSTRVAGDTARRQELIKTGNLLFAQLETSYVWTLCGHHFKEACVRPDDDDDNTDTVGAVGVGPPSLNQICNLIGNNTNNDVHKSLLTKFNCFQCFCWRQCPLRLTLRQVLNICPLCSVSW